MEWRKEYVSNLTKAENRQTINKDCISNMVLFPNCILHVTVNKFSNDRIDFIFSSAVMITVSPWHSSTSIIRIPRIRISASTVSMYLYLPTVLSAKLRGPFLWILINISVLQFFLTCANFFCGTSFLRVLTTLTFVHLTFIKSNCRGSNTVVQYIIPPIGGTLPTH